MTDSNIEESEKIITSDGYTIKLDIVRPSGVRGILPVLIFIHGGGWVWGAGSQFTPAIGGQLKPAKGG